jgi:asparagine synthetase B (glutamine-hydrolysing)
MSYAPRLRKLIRSSVQKHVGEGVGVLLSGGIDSSTIAAYAPGLPAFTGYYRGNAYDERPFAKIAAGERVHHEIQIKPEDFVKNFDAMRKAIKPPFQGPGTFGQYMVAKFAAKHVDVLLSGEGGDELFGGYARLHIVAGVHPPEGYESYKPPADYPDEVAAALRYDWERLPNLLAVDDQVTAAFKLKAVAPLLDPDVVAYVMALPPMERVGKVVLREAMRGIVPDQILNRRDKKGFPVPFVEWAQKDPVRGFVEERIGYVPDRSKPWDRQWWIDLLDAPAPSKS